MSTSASSQGSVWHAMVERAGVSREAVVRIVAAVEPAPRGKACAVVALSTLRFTERYVSWHNRFC